MAAGILRPDSGEVRVEGAQLEPHTAAEAIRRGIGMVQQHFALIGVFSALENVVLGVEPTKNRLGAIDLSRARDRVRAIGVELGVDLPLDAPVETLGVGDRQRLEIARALYRDARLLILDEPTAVLTPSEADGLYATLRRLADGGRAIVVVTHKLDEVVDHADEVTVMRRGKVVLTRPMKMVDAGSIPPPPGRGIPPTPQAPEEEVRALAEAIMGGGLPDEVRRVTGELGPVVLAMKNVTLGRILNGLSVEVRAGEIVGIAGVEGNGQREMVSILAGDVVPDSGRVSVGEVAVVHEDRHKEGLVLDASVRDNVVLGELARFSNALGFLDRPAMDREARARVDRAQAPPNLEWPARALSGGNQQKLVVARAIAKIERAVKRGATALVLAHPTRGVDIGASRAIHAEILEAARRGVAVLVVSADLPELRTLADRILVLLRGCIVARLLPSASDQEIGRAMLGAAEEEARA
jgi:simple sugar transport system ATP-binding protein